MCELVGSRYIELRAFDARRKVDAIRNVDRGGAL